MSFPFKPGFENFPLSHDGHYYPDNPDRLIKADYTPVWARDNIFEYTVQTRASFNELPEKYGIDTLPFSLVPFEGLYGPEIAVVVPMVEPIEVDYKKSPGTITEEQHQASIALTDKHFGYLEAKASNGEAFFGDIFGPHQYSFWPGKVATLLDMAPDLIAPAKSVSRLNRVQSLFLRLDFLMLSSMAICEVDETQRQKWAEAASHLITTISDANGIVFSDTGKEEILDLFTNQKLSDLEDEAIEGICDNELEKPANNAVYEEHRRFKAAEFN